MPGPLNHRPLEESDVAYALGISVDTLKRLIDAGEFPDGFYTSERTKIWSQMDVDAYIHLRGRIGPKPPAGKAKNQAGSA